MKKYIHFPTFLAALVAVASLAEAISYLSGVRFWALFAIILAAMVVNGFVAEVEDNAPGGFNNPNVDDEKSRR